jgi:hypothetical protein
VWSQLAAARCPWQHAGSSALRARGVSKARRWTAVAVSAQLPGPARGEAQLPGPCQGELPPRASLSASFTAAFRGRKRPESRGVATLSSRQ